MEYLIGVLFFSGTFICLYMLLSNLHDLQKSLKELEKDLKKYQKEE